MIKQLIKQWRGVTHDLYNLHHVGARAPCLSPCVSQRASSVVLQYSAPVWLAENGRDKHPNKDCTSILGIHYYQTARLVDGDSGGKTFDPRLD